MSKRELGYRRLYMQADKLYFLYLFAQVFKKMASKPRESRIIKAEFSDFYNTIFRPSKDKQLELYVVWLFNLCKINIYDLSSPKGFFKNEDGMSGNSKWYFLLYRINVATSQGKSINTRYVSFEYNIDEANERANQYLNTYLRQIEKNQITTASHFKIFEKQKNEIISKILEKYQHTGKEKILLELNELEDPKSINFIEAFLILEKQDYIKVVDFKDDYKSAVLLVKEKLLEKLKNTSEPVKDNVVESAPKPQIIAKDDWYFEIRYPDSMEIVLITNVLDRNKLTSYSVGKPQSGSPANEFFEYLEINFFEKEINKGMLKIGKNSELNLGIDIDTMLSNYGIKGYLKKVFFKISTRNKKDLFIINFENCMTKRNLLPNHLEDIKKQVGKLKILYID